jgi:hypothetical protein
MTLVAVRLRFLAVLITVVLPLTGASPVRADIIAQWAFGGATGETSNLKDPSLPGFLDGRTGPGWEATTVDPNATAANAFLSDSIPPAAENYIELTSPPHTDDAGNVIPCLFFSPGSNSKTAEEAVQKDKYFQISATANAGSVLNLSSLTFTCSRGGSSGPRGYVVLSSVDGYTNIVDAQPITAVRPDFENHTIDLSGASFQGLSTVSFRIFVYLPNAGLSIDTSNVTINGKVQ